MNKKAHFCWKCVPSANWFCPSHQSIFRPKQTWVLLLWIMKMVKPRLAKMTEAACFEGQCLILTQWGLHRNSFRIQQREKMDKFPLCMVHAQPRLAVLRRPGSRCRNNIQHEKMHLTSFWARRYGKTPTLNTYFSWRALYSDDTFDSSRHTKEGLLQR